MHGFTEHSLRYEQVAEAISRRGYAVHAIDLRGHGASQGPRVWVRSFDEYLGDVERFLRQLREASPATPTFLWGHSMGGAIAMLVAVDRRPALEGLILSAPLLKMPDHLFPVLRYLAVFVGRVFPRWRVTRFGVKKLSRDPQVVAVFEADPLNFHGRFPVRTGAEILRAVRRIRRRMEAVELPLLLLHGTGDVVTDPEGSRRLHARAASNDKTLQLYKGLYHDLLHEPEWREVLDDVLAWIDARVPPATLPAGNASGNG